MTTRPVDDPLSVVGGASQNGPRESNTAPGRRANAICPGASPTDKRERPTMASLPCPADNPPPSDCPVCGLPSTSATLNRHKGVLTAAYLCPAEHLWQTSWLAPEVA